MNTALLPQVSPSVMPPQVSGDGRVVFRGITNSGVVGLDALAAADQSFARTDMNRDGLIDARENLIIRRNMDPRVASQVFQVVDTNGDGIDPVEFAAYLLSVDQVTPKLTNPAAGPDGVMTLAEDQFGTIQAVLKPEETRAQLQATRAEFNLDQLAQVYGLVASSPTPSRAVSSPSMAQLNQVFTQLLGSF